MDNYGSSEADACELVADEYPSICGLCHCGSFPPTPTPVPGGTVKVMSYNTEYTGYRDGRFSNFASECQCLEIMKIIGAFSSSRTQLIALLLQPTLVMLLQT